MKRTVLLIYAIVICVLFTSCSRTPAPERALSRMLANLADGKLSQAEQYVTNGSLGLNPSNRHARKFYKAMFETITYTINGSETGGDVAGVSVTITVADMSTLLTYASAEALGATFSGSADADIELYRRITDWIDSGDFYYDTNTITVNLMKDGGTWKVDAADNYYFLYAITGGVPQLLAAET